MEIVVAAKLISDFSLYFLFASFFGSLFGLTDILLIPMLVLAISAFMCWLLRKQNLFLRLAPLLLLLLCIPLTHGRISLIVIIPPAVYCVVISSKLLFAAERGAAIGQLRFGLILGVILSIIAGGYIKYHVAVYGTLTFMLIFGLATIMLIRLLRFDAAALASRKLKLVNLAFLVCVCAFGFLFSSAPVLSGIGSFFKLFAKYVISPIFSKIAGILGYIIAAIGKLLGKVELHEESMQNFGQKMSAKELRLNRESERWAGAQTVVYIIIGLIVAIILVVLFFIFKRMVYGKYREANKVITETGSVRGKEKIRKRTAHGTREQVREYYRRFLQLCRLRGVKFTSADTSLDIINAASSVMPSEIEKLRDIYICARYDDDGCISQLDVKRARELYGFIKNFKEK